MPGNELGERVHNFFAQDNSLQGQNHSQAAEGNWPVLNSNVWVGSQRQADLLHPNSRNYNTENSDVDRGEASYPLHVTHGLNFNQSNLGLDFAKSQPLNEQPQLNGFIYGNQFHQARQNEANFLAVDTDSDQRHSITSKGLSGREFQHGNGPDHQPKASFRSETSLSPLSFDLFGGQQQMSHQQSSIPQSLQRQQPGINDMQQLQQQLMFRKMQEFQRQQQLQQFDLRQHNLISQVPGFAKHTSDSQSSLVNGTQNSDALQYQWTGELGTRLPNRGSPSMQGSPSGHGFPSNHTQTQRVVDSVPQQANQSLYGVPVSSSRGLPLNQYPEMVTDRSSMPQMSTAGNFLQSSQHRLLPNHAGAQDEPSISRHKFQNGNLFGLASTQPVNSEVKNIGGLQQIGPMSRNAPPQDFLSSQELAVQPESSHEKATASPQSEVALDPAEEKILFGSDDNIWASFGKIPNTSGEAGNSFDNGGSLNGSWSALMQSAVAETSSSDMAPQEEWSGLISRGPSGGQPSSMHNGSIGQVASLANDNVQMPSARRSGSFPSPDDIYTNNFMGLNQLEQKFQNDPGQRPQTETSQSLFGSLEVAGNWSNNDPPQKSVAQGSQIYNVTTQHNLQAERNARKNSPHRVPGLTGTNVQSNGWNATATIPPGGERVMNAHEAEKSQQNYQNNQVRVMQGEVVHGSSLWKSNSIPNSSIELGDVKSRVGNYQSNQGILSLNDSTSVANYSNVGITEETTSFVQNNYLLNQWKDAHRPARFQGDESVGRSLIHANDPNQVSDSMNSCGKGEVTRHGMENCDRKENSNDSHRSNLSQHTSGAFRESGLSDASDSRSLPIGNQRSINQLSRKISAPRKFQYHPMGNVNDDVELRYGLKQPTNVQDMPHQNTHFVQAKGQSSELQRDPKGPNEESQRENCSSHVPNTSIPFSQPIDTYTSSSQNMLELLHKVDQPTNHGAKMQLRSSECNASSLIPGETSDGIGGFQRSQSNLSQGFGLQLGPPSQRSRFPDHPMSSQNVQETFNSLDSNNTVAEMGDKGQQMGALHSVQSLPSDEATQAKSKHNSSAIPGHGNENSLNKTPGNFTSVFGSGNQYSRINVQNQQITSGQMPMDQHIGLFTGNASQSAQRSAEGLSTNLASTGGITRHNGPNDVQARVPSATIPQRTSQHFAMHNASSNIPKHQHNMSSHIPQSTQPNIVQSSSAPLAQGRVNSDRVFDGEEERLKESSGQLLTSVNTDPASKMTMSLERASSMENPLDESPANSASTEKDFEAFGRSLKPNNFSHQNYSLQSQVQAVKDAEIDPSTRVSKRMKGPDNIADVRESTLEAGKHNAVVGDSFGSSTGASLEVSGTPSFSKSADVSQRNTSQHGNITSQDNLGLSWDVSQRNSSNDYMTSVTARHPQVSPQMAPSWFNQYGTFKNEQMLHIHDSHKLIPTRPGESPSTHGKSSGGPDMHNSEKGIAAPNDTCQVSNNHQNSTPSLVANEHFSSPQSSQLNISGQHPVILRSKKRKTATSELHPWQEEIREEKHALWTGSMAEADWTKAANCLAQKIEDDAEITEDGPPMLRSKRRLILGTHLMQQLFRPAPSSILSAEASTGYESVAYAVSRIALGDACSTASRSSNLEVLCNSMDLPLGKDESSKRHTGRRYVKTTEELMGRARKLDNDFLRLEKSASILELRVECQDLEKFSVINRFARFHRGRGQSENAETVANTQQTVPQKYVTVGPMPRNLPDRVQCLSL